VLGIEATGKVLSAVTRDNRLRFSMSFLQKLCEAIDLIRQRAQPRQQRV
jgi:hypothetical protein